VPATTLPGVLRRSQTRPGRSATAAPLVPVALAAALLLGACAGTSGDDVRTAARDEPAAGRNAATSGDGSGDAAERTTTTVRPPTGSGEAVTLAFAGDSSFQGLDRALATDPAGVLSGIAPVLSGADLTVVNLEAALGTTGTPEPKTFNFRTPPAALDALRAAGVDAVSMANNHGMDYGEEGLADSLEVERSTGFPLLGVGADDTEAYAPLEVEVRGQRIGVIAANDVFDSSLRASWTAGPGKPGVASAEEDHQERLAADVRALRERVDTLVVFLHYGTEKETCPNARQQELVRVLLDAGADAVVGGHAHRVQGAGFLGDKAVAYGLGNFVFTANSPEGAASGVLLITATGRRVDAVEWRPAVIRGGVPQPLSGAAADAALGTMAQRRSCAGLTETPAAPTAPAEAAEPAGAVGG
jgi:poly-gamma-glutamate synthesis protein (capsule biosynthesis protein)